MDSMFNVHRAPLAQQEFSTFEDSSDITAHSFKHSCKRKLNIPPIIESEQGFSDKRRCLTDLTNRHIALRTPRKSQEHSPLPATVEYVKPLASVQETRTTCMSEEELRHHSVGIFLYHSGYPELFTTQEDKHESTSSVNLETIVDNIRQITIYEPHDGGALLSRNIVHFLSGVKDNPPQAPEYARTQAQAFKRLIRSAALIRDSQLLLQVMPETYRQALLERVRWSGPTSDLERNNELKQKIKTVFIEEYEVFLDTLIQSQDRYLVQSTRLIKQTARSVINYLKSITQQPSQHSHILISDEFKRNMQLFVDTLTETNRRDSSSSISTHSDISTSSEHQDSIGDSFVERDVRSVLIACSHLDRAIREANSAHATLKPLEKVCYAFSPMKEWAMIELAFLQAETDYKNLRLRMDELESSMVRLSDIKKSKKQNPEKIKQMLQCCEEHLAQLQYELASFYLKHQLPALCKRATSFYRDAPEFLMPEGFMAEIQTQMVTASSISKMREAIESMTIRREELSRIFLQKVIELSELRQQQRGSNIFRIR
ncbi:hypothetical protein [Endozoicomonas atrinae]|uniref:hypothetical protein n=1 Tax=Endozoicomonas atrinae TaxID=1333660 RepID=UPI00082689CE|nr:hypothetical protein [Endozoicomonas atrinae]